MDTKESSIHHPNNNNIRVSLGRVVVVVVVRMRRRGVVVIGPGSSSSLLEEEEEGLSCRCRIIYPSVKTCVYYPLRNHYTSCPTHTQHTHNKSSSRTVESGVLLLLLLRCRTPPHAPVLKFAGTSRACMRAAARVSTRPACRAPRANFVWVQRSSKLCCLHHPYCMVCTMDDGCDKLCMVLQVVVVPSTNYIIFCRRLERES